MGAPLDIRLIQPPVADNFPWKEAIEAIPQLLWVAIAIALLVIIGPARLRASLSRVSKVSLGGLEIELASKVEEAAVQKGSSVGLDDRGRVARRLERSRALFEGARVLWIDDNPENNAIELEILHDLGTTTDLATTDDVARDQLRRGVYDVLLSDMVRGEDSGAGQKLMPTLLNAPLKPPIIFYVGNSATAKPDQAFGITTRPDTLFHLIADALERRRG